MAIFTILSVVIIPTLFCNVCCILLWISPHSVVKIAIRIYQILQRWYTKKKSIQCVVIYTILYGNYYPPHREFKLICIGKFASRTWVNFTRQDGKNRQRCQQNKFYYAVWQLLLYYYRESPSKILSVWSSFRISIQSLSVNIISWKLIMW